MRRIPITAPGLQKLRADLRRLIEVERPAAVTAIEVARAHGDISENSEYDDAKHNQSLIEGRIRELEGKIASAQVIDPASLSGDRVMFGATVTVEDVDSGEEQTFQLLGTEEADFKRGILSVDSPIGRALLGKSKDDEVSFDVPKGRRTVTVLSVAYK